MYEAIVRINGKEYAVPENTSVLELLAIAGITTEYPYVVCENEHDCDWEVELDDYADEYSGFVTVEFARGGQLYSAAQSKAVKKPTPKPDPLQVPPPEYKATTYSQTINNYENKKEEVKSLRMQCNEPHKLVNVKEEVKMTGVKLTEKIGLVFGKVESIRVQVGLGGVAVMTANGKYVTYNKETGEFTDVTEILMDIGGEYLYFMPVAKAEVGDLIFVNNEFLFVKEIGDRTIVVNPQNNKEEILVPTKNIFGFNFVTKVVNLLDGFIGKDATPDSPFGNMMLPLLLSGDKKNNDLLPLLMMQQGGDADIQKILPLLLMGGKVDPVMLMAMQGGGDMKQLLPLLLMKDGSKDDLLPLLMLGGDIFGGLFGKTAPAPKAGRPSSK